MKIEPLRFEVEYSIANPPWEKGRPKYTAKVVVTDRRALEVLGCSHLDRLEKELEMHFWDWSAMQEHVARLVGTICGEIVFRHLPEQPVVEKGHTTQFRHPVSLGAYD